MEIFAQPSAVVPVAAEHASPATERHYSVNEIAALWNLGSDTVRRVFEKEPGVVILGNADRKYGRRRYITLRIPESVVERVHRRLCRV